MVIRSTWHSFCFILDYFLHNSNVSGKTKFIFFFFNHTIFSSRKLLTKQIFFAREKKIVENCTKTKNSTFILIWFVWFVASTEFVVKWLISSDWYWARAHISIYTISKKMPTKETTKNKFSELKIRHKNARFNMIIWKIDSK